MPCILLFGTGSVGAVYAYLLEKGGANVAAVCRSNYEAVRANGFIINSTKYGDVHFKPKVVRQPADATGSWDFIVVCAKSMPGSNPSQAEIIKPAVGPDTVIVLIQNGIAIEEEFAELFPTNPILSCVTYLPVTQTSPGIIAHKEVERLQIGTYPAREPRAQTKMDQFVAIMKGGGGNIEVYEDIQAERWSKLVVNAAWNPVTALSRSRDAYFLRSSPEAVDMIHNIMLEVAKVARAAGYEQINEQLVEHQLRRARVREVPGVEPSMMADALHGRAMEVEAIVGSTIKIAKRHNVETPLLSTIYVLAKALDDSLARDRGGA
jgi:2-dehydropantoate 2-reductase